jgi:hypothetical protein
MIVLRTEDFEDDLRRMRDGGLDRRVDEIVQQMEAASSLLMATRGWDVDRVKGNDNLYFKKRTGSSNVEVRLIACVKELDDEQVIVLLRLFSRNDRGYEQFGLAGLPEPTLNKLRELRDARVQSAAPLARPEELPTDYRGWLEPPVEIKVDVSRKLMVFESKRWGSAVSHETVTRRLESLADLLLETAIDPAGGDTVVGLDGVRCRRKDRLTVYYVVIANESIFLLDVVSGEHEVADRGLTVPEDFRRSARCAYPADILDDQDLWEPIEKGATSNLALSPEEESLLREISGDAASPGSQLLPMFVNGRAGSGKSTMLMYVMAGLIRRLHRENLRGQPIFLTYNDQLLRNARTGVLKLINTNVQFSDMQDKMTERDLAPYFSNFRDLLRGSLSEDVSARFAEAARVDFHDFRRWFEGERSAIGSLKSARGSGWAPEQSWFVIRSLIKGRAAAEDEELSPDEYDLLPRKDRQVDSSLFRLVFDQIYPAYKSALAEYGRWDDQDLVSKAIIGAAAGAPERDISAVVCDEAQDFTRREIGFLIRLSKLTRYQWSRGVDAKTNWRLPIVVAGDPMQSISPSGFRIDHVGATLYEQLSAVAPSCPVPEVRELETNYRSSAPIVRLSNSIQLWRREMFDLANVRAQRPWREDEAWAPPRRFVLAERGEFSASTGGWLSVERFRDLTADTAIIVPCELSGELDYVRNDPVLREKYPDASPTNPPPVYSASLAKGLEFERVVMYKFGEEGRTILRNVNRAGTQSADRDFRGEYFFNKLYVAATRATSRLYVVDTEAGNRDFWSGLDESETERRRRDVEKLHGSKLGDPPFTADLLGVIQLAEHGEDEELREDNVRQQAEQLASKGMETRNSQLLRHAARGYQKCGIKTEERRCLAEALMIDGDFREAGQSFMELGHHADAWAAFWSASDWATLSLLSATYKRAPRVQVSAVDFMVLKIRTRAEVEALLLELGREKEPRPEIVARERQWLEIVGVLADTIARWGGSELAAMSGDCGIALERLALLHYPSAARLAGLYFFAHGDYARARDLLLRDPKKSAAREIAMCQARLTSGEEAMRHLVDGHVVDEAVQYWVDAGRPYTGDWPALALTAMKQLRGEEWAADTLALRTYFLVKSDDARADTDTFPIAVTRYLRDHPNDTLPALEAVGALGSRYMFRPMLSLLERGGSKMKHMEVALSLKFVRSAVTAALRSPQWPSDFESVDHSALEQILDLIADTPTTEMMPLKGCALEMAGRYVTTLRFYEKYTEAQDADVRDYARRRWVKVKSSQLLSRTIPDPAAHQRTLERNRRAWRIDPERVAEKPRLGLQDDVVDVQVEPRLDTSMGSIANVQWDTNTRGVVRIEVQTGGVLHYARIDPSMRTLQVSEKQPIEGRAVVITAVGDVRLEVDFETSMSIVITAADGSIARVLMNVPRR